MKEIQLTKGKIAIVDDEDFEWLSQWKWRLDSKGYAKRNQQKGEYLSHNKRGTIQMQRAIMNTPRGLDTDHINGNPLDNRKSNLRICTSQQNQFNQKAKFGASKYKGVSLNRGRWRAQINIIGVKTHIGSFGTEEEAARAYDNAALNHFGEFARLNFPQEREMVTQ